MRAQTQRFLLVYLLQSSEMCEMRVATAEVATGVTIEVRGGLQRGVQVYVFEF